MLVVGVEMTYFRVVVYIIKFYNMLIQISYSEENDALYHRILT